MFLSIGLILLLGVFGGILFDKIKLPKLVFYLLLGILLGPSLLNIIDESLLNISSYLRQVALVIILTRSGLTLDISTLKKIGRPAILMCFIPATLEIIGVSIFAPMLLDISFTESLLLGSVLAAVSPAVVVPRMLKLIDEKYGSKKFVPQLVLAGVSCDDIYVIVLFYAFKSMLKNNEFNYLSFIDIPISIILGIIVGIIFGIILLFIYKKTNFNTTIKVVLLLSVSFIMIGIEKIVNISGLIGIISCGITILFFNKECALELKKSYNNLWFVFEILLFVLVGCTIDLNYAFSTTGLIMCGILLIGLFFRCVGVVICLVCTKYNFKEKIFIILSYLPKATVQASIGGIALAEGLSCGKVILTSAVISIIITAPIGAILIDKSYKKLLKGDLNEEEV